MALLSPDDIQSKLNIDLTYPEGQDVATRTTPPAGR